MIFDDPKIITDVPTVQQRQKIDVTLRYFLLLNKLTPGVSETRRLVCQNAETELTYATPCLTNGKPER